MTRRDRILLVSSSHNGPDGKVARCERYRLWSTATPSCGERRNSPGRKGWKTSGRDGYFFMHDLFANLAFRRPQQAGPIRTFSETKKGGGKAPRPLN